MLHQHKKSYDLGSHRNVHSHEPFPENPNNLTDVQRESQVQTKQERPRNDMAKNFSNLKVVTPQLNASHLQQAKGQPLRGLFGSDALDQSEGIISNSNSVPRFSELPNRGYHSIEHGGRGPLAESDQKTAVSSISPNQLSLNLSNANP